MRSNTSAPKIREIDVAEFAAHCHALLAEAQSCDEQLVVTENGKPIATVTPNKVTPNGQRKKFAYGYMRDEITILGDIEDPIDVVWEAEHGLIDGR